MYSVLPTLVSALFLGYGLYVVAEKGFNRVSTSFLVLCVTTFFWRATWAVLFQVRDADLARILIKFGCLLILFLPTSLYQFLAELSQRRAERRWVWASYGFAAVLAVFDVAIDLFVRGLGATTSLRSSARARQVFPTPATEMDLCPATVAEH